MNVLPALAEHLRQHIPNIFFMANNPDGTFSFSADNTQIVITITIKQNRTLWYNLHIDQDDNIITFSTHEFPETNPCGEIALGPMVDLCDLDSIQKITNIIRHWFYNKPPHIDPHYDAAINAVESQTCSSPNSPKSLPGSTVSDPEPPSTI